MLGEALLDPSFYLVVKQKDLHGFVVHIQEKATSFDCRVDVIERSCLETSCNLYNASATLLDCIGTNGALVDAIQFASSCHNLYFVYVWVILYTTIQCD